MARHAHLVPFGVAKVGAEVVGVVLRAQAWRAFWRCAVGQCHRKGAHDHFSALGEERDHLPIAGGVCLRVVGLADQKQGRGSG